MQKHINYEDNIFILNTRIRGIADLLLLDPEPDFFLERTLDDLDFISLVLGKLLTGLLENKHLIDRDEQFRNLYDAEETYYVTIKKMLNGQTAFLSAEAPDIAEKLNTLAEKSGERQKAIRENMREGASPLNDPRVVSVEELTMLVG